MVVTVDAVVPSLPPAGTVGSTGRCWTGTNQDSPHREGLGRPGIQVVTPSAVTKLHDQALLDALQCCSIATIPAAGAWGWITSHLSRLDEHSRYPDGATTLNVLLQAGDYARRYLDAPTDAVISPTCAWGCSLSGICDHVGHDGPTRFTGSVLGFDSGLELGDGIGLVSELVVAHFTGSTHGQAHGESGDGLGCGPCFRAWG